MPCPQECPLLLPLIWSPESAVHAGGWPGAGPPRTATDGVHASHSAGSFCVPPTLRLQVVGEAMSSPPHIIEIGNVPQKFHLTKRLHCRAGAGREMLASRSLREAGPMPPGPDDVTFAGNGTRIVKTPVRSRANSYAERFVGTVRRECLDHLLVLGGRRHERRRNAAGVHYCREYMLASSPGRIHNTCGSAAAPNGFRCRENLPRGQELQARGGADERADLDARVQR